MSEADQTPNPVLPIAGQISTLPTQSVAHFGLSVTVAEFILALGQSHAVMTPTENAQSVAVGQQWFLGLSISPPAALRLYKTLEIGLRAYRETYGEIPEDPHSHADVAEFPKRTS